MLKIQARKKEQTNIWKLDGNDLYFILSIDGILCSIEERNHATKLLESKYYSHKTCNLTIITTMRKVI